MLGRIFLAGSALSLTTIYLYARYLHQSLASQISNTEISAEERRARYESGKIKCLPSELVESSQDFRVIHVQDERSGAVSIPNDPGKAEKLFTMLLRRNMRIFSQTPQAWMMRMLAKTPEQKRSYAKAHIESLDYQEGDLFCGFNRVLKREPTQIEIELILPEGMGSKSFGGRLVISLTPSGRQAVLRTQTIQWTRSDDAMVLPLERGAANFLHETASWYLIVSGVEYLKDIAATA